MERNRIKYIPTNYGVQGDKLFDGIAAAAQDIAKSIGGIGIGEKPNKPKGKGEDAKSKPKAESKLNSSKQTIQAIAHTAKSCREDYNRSSLKKLVHYMRVALTAISKEKNITGSLKDHTQRLAALYKVLVDNIKEAKMRENYDNLDEFLDEIVETMRIPRSAQRGLWDQKVRDFNWRVGGDGDMEKSNNLKRRGLAKKIWKLRGKKNFLYGGKNTLRHKNAENVPTEYLEHDATQYIDEKIDEIVGMINENNRVPRTAYEDKWKNMVKSTANQMQKSPTKVNKQKRKEWAKVLWKNRKKRNDQHTYSKNLLRFKNKTSVPNQHVNN